MNIGNIIINIFHQPMENETKISLYLRRALFRTCIRRKGTMHVANIEIFATCIVPDLYPQERIKRESGVNPGQSRCCKLHYRLGNTISHCSFLNGKALKPEVSQKTCKAYYFDGFEERPEENRRSVNVSTILTPVSRIAV